MSDMPHDNTITATYEALIASRDELLEANKRLTDLIAELRLPSPGETVTLPAPAERRSAQVSRGHSRHGHFVRASVAVRSAGANDVLIETDEISPASTATPVPPSTDDALEDLEGRLLVALADVRALRIEVRK